MNRASATAQEARVTELAREGAPLTTDFATWISELQREPAATRDARLLATPHPVSFTQRRALRLSPLGPADPSLNIVYGVRLLGDLGGDDASVYRALRGALSSIVQRHAIFRTQFEAGAVSADSTTGWRQRVVRSAEVSIDRSCLRALSDQERQQVLQRAVDEEAARPFALGVAPLLRARWFELGDEEHVLVLATHQLVFDGWSFGVLLDELAAQYAATQRQQALRPDRDCDAPSGDLPSGWALAYADYARWQLARPLGEAERAYWDRVLCAPLPSLALPTDRPRPAVRTLRGETWSFSLDPATCQRALALARAETATPFMLFLAAYLLLLHQESGQVDLVVGTPVAGRDHAELEGVIGPLVNHLVFRANLTETPTFRALLRRVRDAALDLYEQKGATYESLRERYEPTEDPSRAPLFQARFLVHNTPPPTGDGGLRRGNSIDARRTVALFDLSLGLEYKHTWCGSFEYSTDLFDRSTIERWVEEYGRLLRCIAADADQPLARMLRAR